MSQPTPNAELQQLADDYWTTLLARQPVNATLIGIHDHDDRFGDLSRESEDAHIAALREFVAAAEAYRTARAARLKSERGDE